MGVFERYLSVWVAAAIAIGVALGVMFPPLFELIAKAEVAHVNIVVALFIWVMIYPMMVQVDFSTIKEVGKNPKGLILTLISLGGIDESSKDKTHINSNRRLAAIS